MSVQPAVSVIIPTYNQPKLLAETLDSVLGQTFVDYEVIVVDDGSTDDTLQQLQPYRRRFAERLGSSARFRIMSQPNAGTGAARNRGMEEAQGRYLALLDHDDTWMPEKLAIQVRFLEEHPHCAAAVVPYASSLEPGKPVFDPFALTDASGLVNRPLRKLADKQPLLMTCSVLMFRRNVARDLQFAGERGVIEDVPFQIRLLARGPLGIAGRQVLAIYRFHASNTSAQAPYFYGGIKLLRRMDRKGQFAELSPGDRADMLAWLAFIGRAAAVTQLLQGRRLRGLEVYFGDFAQQLRQRRLDFLLAYPVMALLPRSFTQAWSRKGSQN